ncbi:MAG TPA: hypothetical protein VK615_09690, partial [Candidatus Binatia bacterium]|nr:hypothetical protein [Candidatus Binatia bacterium]
GSGNGFLTIKYLEINSPPHADASATAPLAIAPNNRSARVVLDGSRSSDPDGDLLDFSWSVRGIGFARGMVVTEELGLGRHTITLTVDDGIASDTDDITVAVITPCEAVQAIAEFLQLSGFTGNRRALLTTLDHVCKSFDGGDIAGGVKDLQAFQSKVRAQVTRYDRALASELIRQAQVIIDAVTE